MNLNLHSLALGTVAALLCSCAATSVEKTWKSPDCRQPVGKIAVLAIDDRGLVRKGFENRFVRQLKQTGSTAMVTYDLLSLPEIKENKQAAAERFRASGAEALLILRLVSTSTSYREIKTGQDYHAGVAVGVISSDADGWYEYYSVGYMNLSPTYGSLKQKVYLETSLYDLNTEQRLWSGLTRTVLKENVDRVAEMDPLVEMFVATMQKDGVIR